MSGWEEVIEITRRELDRAARTTPSPPALPPSLSASLPTFMASSVNSLTLNLLAASMAFDRVGFEMIMGMALGLGRGRGGEGRGEG